MKAESIYARSPVWIQNLMLNAYAMRIDRYRRGAEYRSQLALLHQSQFWDRGRLEVYKDERIRLVVKTAYERSSFYRRAMQESGVKPADIKGADDLHRLPLITKETVRDNGEDLLTAQLPQSQWRHGHTSGTTGSPLSLWYDRSTCIINDAVDWRQKQWGGMAADDWIGVFLGRVLVPLPQQKPPFWRANTVHRQVWFSSFHLSDENLQHYVAEIRRLGLRFIEGYPSTLFILAQFLARNQLQLPMTAVFTSSETLHAVQRETMEAAFCCPVFDFFGHAERTIFATECEFHRGKHLAEEYGFTEIVDESGRAVPEGKPGYLVGTSLHNLAMPMIRYRTTDLSSITTESCECGRRLVRIADISTKAEDIVVTPDGRMISPSILTHPFKPHPEILKSQLIQNTLDTLTVKIVPSKEFRPEQELELRSELARRLGSGMRIDIVRVTDIPSERSGKYRWVISSVPHMSHFAWDS